MKSFTDRPEDRVRALDDIAPRVLPFGVTATNRFWNAHSYRVKLGAIVMTVLLEAEVVDGELWAHMSVCGQKPPRLPTWEELRWCKETFLGVDRKAIQVLPPKKEYVNIHQHVLHLYAPLERDPLPDFRAMMGEVAGI